MIPYMVGKLALSSLHLTRGLVKYVPGRGYFRAVPSQNGDNYATSPLPLNRRTGLYGGTRGKSSRLELVAEMCDFVTVQL